MKDCKIYPRTGDTQTVYLKSVVTRPTIEVRNFNIYNDFVNAPRDFEKNNALYHYPININGIADYQIVEFTPTMFFDNNVKTLPV